MHKFVMINIFCFDFSCFRYYSELPAYLIFLFISISQYFFFYLLIIEKAEDIKSSASYNI